MEELKNKILVLEIGASAGGLTAFKEFIRAVPEKSNMSFMGVQHPDPKQELSPGGG